MKKLILLLLLIPNLVIAETWICTNEDKKLTFKRNGDKFLVNEINYGKEDEIKHDQDQLLQIYHENNFSIWLIQNPENHIAWVEIYQLNKVYRSQKRNKLHYRFLTYEGDDKLFELFCGVSG